MFVRVRDTKRPNRKNVMRIGGEVKIKSMPGATPLSRIHPDTQPVIASIDRVNGQKMATVEYRDVQDGEVHVVGLPPSSLRSHGDPLALNIGDRVTLVNRGVGVCASVGSNGTVLGGSGPHTVTFEITTDPTTGANLEEVVTLTQNQVPRSDLKFEGEAVEDGGEEEGSSDESEEESDDDIDVNSDAYHVNSEVLSSLHKKLAPAVYAHVTMILNLDELEELSFLVDDNPDVDTRDANAVIHLLTQ
jgi:hypothetical protein